MTESPTFFGRDRREKQRFNIRLQVVVIVERLGVRHPYAFVTRDISESGLFIMGRPQDFAVGPDENFFDLTLQLGVGDDAEVTLVAEIMHRSVSGDGFGLKISRISPDAEARLADFIADYAAKNPESVDD